MRTPPVARGLLSAVRQRPSLLRTPILQPCTLLRRSSTEGLDSTTTTPPQQPRPLSIISEASETAPKTTGPRISRIILEAPPRRRPGTPLPRRQRDTPVQTSIANDVTASLHPHQQTYSFLGNFGVKIVPDKRRNVKISRAEPLFLFQESEHEELDARVEKVRVENFNGETVGYLPDNLDKSLVRVMAARFLTFTGVCTGTNFDVKGNVSAVVEVHFTSPWEKEAKELWKWELGRDIRRKNKHQTPSAFTLNSLSSVPCTSIADEVTQSLRPPQNIVSYGFFHSSIIGTNHFLGKATTSIGDTLIIRPDYIPQNVVRASTVDNVTVGYLSWHQAGCFADYLKEGVLNVEAVVTKVADHEFPHDLPVRIELLGHETRKDELARLFEHLERTWNFQRTA